MMVFLCHRQGKLFDDELRGIVDDTQVKLQEAFFMPLQFE